MHFQYSVSKCQTDMEIVKYTFTACIFLCNLGDIPDLFSDEEVDMIVTSIRMELRGLGLVDSRDNCWSFFIERIRRQLKVRGSNMFGLIWKM